MWRNSYRRPRMFGLDGRVFILLIVCIFHIRLWTIELALLVAAVMAAIELWKKITIEDAYRGLRSMLAGAHRPGRVQDLKRRAIDYGYLETLHQEGRL